MITRRIFVAGLPLASAPAMAQTLYPPDADYQVVIHGDGGQMLVGIRPDGTIDFGPDYTPEGAAKIFWDTVQRLNPGKCRDT